MDQPRHPLRLLRLRVRRSRPRQPSVRGIVTGSLKEGAASHVAFQQGMILVSNGVVVAVT